MHLIELNLRRMCSEKLTALSVLNCLGKLML